MGGYLIGGRLVAGGGLDAGEITVRAVPASSSSFELPLNRDGSIDVSVKLPMVDPITGARVDLPNVLVPGRDFLGWVEKNGDTETIIEAGPIWTDPFSFPNSSRIVANGLWSYFDHRFILPLLTPGQLPRDVTTRWTGLSLRTIVKRLVEQACAHPNSALPIDYEDDITGTHDREYPGSDLKTVGEALSELTGVENGPDITFRPKWGEDRRHVRWALLTGAPELAQAGHPHYWDVSVIDPHASIETLDRDATDLSSRDFQTGATFRNLKSNNSFEEDLDGYEAAANATGVTIGTDSPAHGSKFARWQSVAGGDAWLAAKQTFDVEPGEPVLCAAYMRTSAAFPVRTLIRFKDASGAIVSDSYGTPVTVPAGSVWTRPYALAVAPSNAHSFEIFLGGNATAAGQWIAADAITVSKAGELIPYAEAEVQIEAVATAPHLTDAGYPLLESVTARSSVKRTTTLQAYAAEGVARGASHVETFTIVTRRDKAPFFGTYWPGDYANLRIGENPRIPKGTHSVRIMSFTFSATGDIHIVCAPERVASGYPVPSTSRTWLRDRLAAIRAAINESLRG